MTSSLQERLIQAYQATAGANFSQQSPALQKAGADLSQGVIRGAPGDPLLGWLLLLGGILRLALLGSDRSPLGAVPVQIAADAGSLLGFGLAHQRAAAFAAVVPQKGPAGKHALAQLGTHGVEALGGCGNGGRCCDN